jgi:hexosaminidase
VTILVSVLLPFLASLQYGEEKRLAVIPKPRHATLQEGRFILNRDTVIVVDSDSFEKGWQLSHMLATATGYFLRIQTSAPDNQPWIEVRIDRALNALSEEGYRLEVTPRRLSIRAPKIAGLFYAFQTLKQLLPVQIFREARIAGVDWTIPCFQIEDSPRFKWRGALLDVARHFMPKQFVKRFIDLLALQKLNVFHWHLTDDQGWRVQIKKYPKLTEVGAWRKETLVGHWKNNKENPKFDGKPHGGFYSQEDIREIVEYARARNVTIVPEIEMPGHATAAIASYPELGNTEQPLAVSMTWGIHESIFNVNETSIRFLQDVLSEILELFPSKFIHVGGDEAVKTQWKASLGAQSRMKELGLKDEEELQSYFIRRMDDFLTSKGRRLIGWDEIRQGGLAMNAAVMSWRGEQGGIVAVKSGHDVVMTPTHHTYLDYYQSTDTSKEPLAIGDYLPLAVVYDYEPIPSELSLEESKHVLGTQGQIWTEYMPTPNDVEYMAFPRPAALAEVAWTPADQRSYFDFIERLRVHLKRLEILDVNYRPVDP